MVVTRSQVHEQTTTHQLSVKERSKATITMARSSSTPTASLKNVALLSVILFSFMSLFLFVQHEMHMMKREAGGFEKTYKRFQKTVSEDLTLLRNTVSEDFKLIKDTATTILAASSHRTAGSGDDTPKADDDSNQDDDIREDDDDVIQEPGEEDVRYWMVPQAAGEALAKISDTLVGAFEGVQSGINSVLHPELPVPQDHMRPGIPYHTDGTGTITSSTTTTTGETIAPVHVSGRNIWLFCF